MLILWLVADALPFVRLHVMAPWLGRVLPDRTLRALVHVPPLFLSYLLLPLLIVVRRNGWTARDLGLVWRTRSQSAAAFAVGFGVAG